MKGKYRKIIGILFICLITYLGITIIHKMKEKDKLEALVATIPKFDLLQLNGSNFTDLNLQSNTATVFIYLNSECDFCQHEAQSISDNLNKFKDVQFIFVSTESAETIRQFSEKYNLDKQQNVTFLHDNSSNFSNQFGASSVPYLLIYDENHALIKKHKGQLNADGILKTLNL